MRVTFVDLAIHGKPIEADIMAAVSRVLTSGVYVGGPEVEAFEREFADFCGAAEAVGVDSGTHALTFALLAAGVRPGDEVITSPMSFIATAEAITHAGGVPVFADVDPWTGLIDVSLAIEAITPKTRAIVPVHLYGQPAEMDQLLALARERGIAVVEDACQAHGAEYRGRRAGGLGDIGAFSFYPSKNLGACGEGGAVTTNQAALARSVRLLRDHGQSKRYHHETIGYNGRLDAIQAAILRVKLRSLDEWNSQRRKNALLYNQALGEIPGVFLPSHPLHVLPVYHLYVIQVENRDRVRERLAARGIETGLHYPVPIHLQPAYRSLGYKPGAFPVAERMASRVLSLPLYPELTESQIAYVAEHLKASL